MRAYLYDAEGVDGEHQLDGLDVGELRANQLLWVDVDDAVEDEVRAAGKLFGLDDETVEALLETSGAPALFFHLDYFHVAVTEVQGDGEEYRARLLDCVAGRNWVLTSHHVPLEFLKSFDDRYQGDSNVGRFGSAGFVSALLNEQLQTYSRKLKLIVNEIDHVEQLVLRDRVDEDKLVRRLISINQRITRLRRWLEPHTEIYERLAEPTLSELLPEETTEPLFAANVLHVKRTIDSLDSARQVVTGSLGLYMTLVAHSTNKVIKLLTVVSVTLLPPTFLTGFLGMNDVPNSLRGITAFWVGTAVMLLVATTTLAVARRRGWI